MVASDGRAYRSWGERRSLSTAPQDLERLTPFFPEVRILTLPGKMGRLLELDRELAARYGTAAACD